MKREDTKLRKVLNQTVTRVWEQKLSSIEQYELLTGVRLSQKEFENVMGLKDYWSFSTPEAKA